VVIERAKQVLEKLERTDREGGKQMALLDDLPLFRAAPAPAPRPAPQKSSAVEDRLKAIHPDELTPIEALKLVYDLRALSQD
jgi:DNA mismatch repair protein MutS